MPDRATFSYTFDRFGELVDGLLDALGVKRYMRVRAVGLGFPVAHTSQRRRLPHLGREGGGTVKLRRPRSNWMVICARPCQPMRSGIADGRPERSRELRGFVDVPNKHNGTTDHRILQHCRVCPRCAAINV